MMKKDEPEKMDLRSLDISEEKKQELLSLFPEIRTEGDKIDFEKLKLALGDTVDVGRERYGMNWPGKAECFKVIQTPSMGTLLPCPEESVNFDTTENLIIEGDNLEILKLLQKSYMGKIKMIYIDPPYNTGNDFIYPDNYTESLQTYLEYTGQADAEGKKFGTNSDADGRFHSKWMNMMYPRLYLARNLLSEEGVIFISIGDQEYDNLAKLCNEIFGEDNFITNAIWEKKKKGAFLAAHITNMKDYIFIYCRSKDKFKGLIGQIVDEDETYPCVNASNPREIRVIPAGIKSKYREKDYFLKAGSKISAGTMDLILKSDLVIRNGILDQELRIEGNWRYTQELMIEYAKNDDLYITQDLYLRRIVRDQRKKTLRDLFLRLGTSGYPAKEFINPNDLFEDGWGTNEDANEELRVLLGEQNLLDYPKPSHLIAKIACSYRDKEALILDFFAGSGTSAHAVLELNKVDGGNRKFILVQLPETIDHKKYSTIADICKERVRQVIKRLNHSENGRLALNGNQKKDLGFKVFKLAKSNFKAWDVGIKQDMEELEKQLELHVEHILENRKDTDILYEILLKSGFQLTTPIETITIEGKNVYSVAGGALFICLERELTMELIRTMAEKKPERVVCLDEGFSDNDQLKANAVQIFKTKGITSFKTV